MPLCLAVWCIFLSADGGQNVSGFFSSRHGLSLIAEKVSGQTGVYHQVQVSFPQNERVSPFFCRALYFPHIQRSYREKSIEVKARETHFVPKVTGTRPQVNCSSCPLQLILAPLS